MRYYLISTYLFFVFCLFSCEEQTPLKTNSETNAMLVVEGIITNELDYFSIKLSNSVSNINDTITPNSGAIVKIISAVNGNQNVQEINLVEDSQVKGKYNSPSQQRAVLNRDYTLQISYDGKIYTAKAIMIPISAINPVTYYSLSDTLSLYRINENFNSKENAMFEITYDWDFNNDCDSCKAKAYYYSLNSIDVGQIFAPAKQNVKFPKGTVIIQKKYALSDSHADFIRQFLLETEWNGGYFDENPAPVAGNLSSGAVGYFGACMVLSDTLIVE